MQTKLTLIKSKSAGFTLVELLITIMILGILVSAVLTVINPAKQRLRAQDGVLKGAISKIGAAVDAYYAAKIELPSVDTFRDEVESENYYAQNGNHYFFTMQGINTGHSGNRLHYSGYSWMNGCVSARSNEYSADTFFTWRIRDRMRKCTITHNSYKNDYYAPYYVCGIANGWWSWMGSCTDDLN